VRFENTDDDKDTQTCIMMRRSLLIIPMKMESERLEKQGEVRTK
jgi:hypothetical protein